MLDSSRNVIESDIHNEGFDAEFDRLNSLSTYSLRENVIDKYLSKITSYSEEFKKNHGDSIQTVKYGKGPKQIMEIARSANAKDDTPIMMFVHGGCWVETSRYMHLYTVGQAFARGWIGVNVGYDQAPEASLSAITDEIRDAYICLSSQFPKSRGVAVTGHSAGGHLVSMLLATNWDSYNSENINLLPITKCVPISPILDVRRYARMSYNEQLKLTRTETTHLSPLLQIDIAIPTIKRFATKTISVVGERDPPSFKQDAKEYTEALKLQSVDAEYIEFPNLDHFQIIEKLVEPDYELNKIIYD